MNDKHITEILDSTALAALSPSELDEIRAHARDCEACSDAFAAAQLSALVIKERAQATIEPSPFFHTRVMAAVREQQAAESVPAFSRLWKSARGLVSSMALTTAALAALSFVVAAPATAPSDQTTAALSAESVILGQDADDLTYEQVMNAIYTDDEDK
jgi:hypothetical protein